ncbi:MAG: hypothetical protein H0U92_12905 [Actinobacteria bacterium]|nr:hypothetical protein [Actinomycetota bacterium]
MEVLVAEPTDDSVCESVAAVADVVLTSEGLDPRLRDCLLAARRTIVGFDQAGTGETLLSTRRGVGDALADLAPLRGKVGVVASARIKSTVEPTLSNLGASEAVYLDDGTAATAQIPDGVRRFASKGIDVVVFALPVDQQKRWASLQSVLAPNVGYVVADAFDAFADEAYPALFEGATAVTSQRSSWFARDHGETQQQADCRTRWENVAKPSRLLDEAEKRRVYSWCQNAALVAQALMAEGPLASAIAQTRLVSPLTSDLAPLATGSFGPTLVATLVWRASCSCWKERTPFASPTYARRSRTWFILGSSHHARGHKFGSCAAHESLGCANAHSTD